MINTIATTGTARQETTEQYIARLIANPDLPSLQQDEVAVLVDLIEARALAWKRVAARIREQSERSLREADRVQKSADDLAEFAKRLAQL